ncbi:murein transglycosylase A [uncultured Enterovirga sp.]|uniref:murein transglycosylase A n=1 Tax=uncultured Enterovirga sp. TaxID=2026352 RepID=UPI0035CB03F1
MAIARPSGGPEVLFAGLEGWLADDHAGALRAFRAGCRSAKTGVRHPTRTCRAAARVGPSQPEARRFFERWFDPAEVSARGFLTGYYEPELPGSLTPDSQHRTPLLAKPADLVVRSPVGAPPGWPEGRTAARRTPSGFEPLQERGAIEDGALGEAAAPLVYLADQVDAFMVHVQGSARIRLPDGKLMRVGFDGRNGHPYTSIGRVLADQEGIAPAEMTADRLVAWLKANPDRAPGIMRANRSYIFFREVESKPGEGPVGAAGIPLVAGKSLAVDRSVWRYGTLVWLEGDLPRPEGGTEPLRRLVVAQDTGAAIVGPARGDLFFGSGTDAGARASLARQQVRWVVLQPRPRPRPEMPR